MIQSYLVDLKNMNSQILIKVNGFIKNRLIEFSGFFLVIIGIFLLLSILSYSPNDPNFIYSSENKDINVPYTFYKISI